MAVGVGKRQQQDPQNQLLPEGLVSDLPLAAVASREGVEPWVPPCRALRATEFIYNVIAIHFQIHDCRILSQIPNFTQCWIIVDDYDIHSLLIIHCGIL